MYLGAFSGCNEQSRSLIRDSQNGATDEDRTRLETSLTMKRSQPEVYSGIGGYGRARTDYGQEVHNLPARLLRVHTQTSAYKDSNLDSSLIMRFS